MQRSLLLAGDPIFLSPAVPPVTPVGSNGRQAAESQYRYFLNNVMHICCRKAGYGCVGDEEVGGQRPSVFILGRSPRDTLAITGRQAPLFVLWPSMAPEILLLCWLFIISFSLNIDIFCF